jgi:hypothetical protein
VATLSKASVCGCSLAGIVDSNPAGACLSLVSAVYCEVEVSALGQSLDYKNPTDCGVSECGLETSTMSRPRPTRAVEP